MWQACNTGLTLLPHLHCTHAQCCRRCPCPCYVLTASAWCSNTCTRLHTPSSGTPIPVPTRRRGLGGRGAHPLHRPGPAAGGRSLGATGAAHARGAAAQHAGGHPRVLARARWEGWGGVILLQEEHGAGWWSHQSRTDNPLCPHPPLCVLQVRTRRRSFAPPPCPPTLRQSWRPTAGPWRRRRRPRCPPATAALCQRCAAGCWGHGSGGRVL